MTEGVGSRYFNIENNGSTDGDSQGTGKSGALHEPFRESLLRESKDLLHNREVNVLKKEMRELDRFQFPIDDFFVATFPGYEVRHGYMEVGDQLRPLPIGSTFKPKSDGSFYWQPGPGFSGRYRFLFVGENAGGGVKIVRLALSIVPKFSNR